MDFECWNSAVQFSIPQSQNTIVIPNATPNIKFYLNMLGTVRWADLINSFETPTLGNKRRKFRDGFCLQFFQASWAKNYDLSRVIAVHGTMTIKFNAKF